MDAISWIATRFSWLSEYFYKAYLEINDLPWPFWMAAWPFYLVSEVCAQITWDIVDFYHWAANVSNKIAEILSWSTVWDTLASWLPNLEAINSWFYNWWDNVRSVVLDFWKWQISTIMSWIDQAKAWTWLWIDYLQEQVNALSVKVDEALRQIPDVTELLAWFSNWWYYIRRNLDSWWSERLYDINNLINSAFVIRQGFWAGWQDWRDKVTEFFTDPEDWLYKSMDRIIERFW